MILLRSFIRQIPLLTALAVAPWAAWASNTQDSALLVQLKKAADRGDYTQFSRLQGQLSANSLFAPYADAWQFRLLQGGTKRDDGKPTLWRAQEIQYVLNKNPSSWPSEELRREWLAQLAQHGEWALYTEERPKLRYRPDLGVECADVWFASTKGTVQNHEWIKVLTHEKGIPRVCRALIKHGFETKQLKDTELNLRVFTLVANNQAGLVSRYLDEMQGTTWRDNVPAGQVDKAISSPNGILNDPNADSFRDVVLGAALAKLAMSDVDLAADKLRAVEKNLRPETRQWVWAHLGHRAALLWDRQALGFYKKSNVAVMSPEQKEWRVRAALLVEDWPEVAKAIDELPEKMAEDNAWRYWKARARAAAGNIEQARAIWAGMASPFNFYGKLATEELGVSISAPAKPKPLSPQEVDEAKRNPGLQRALALYDAGLTKEGFWEFNLQVAQMNDRQLLAAANWAHQNELFDRAIAAADRTQQEHDLSLRYLTPFRDTLVSKAKSIGVDEAWVYGIIRQESRFVTIAKSHVGASGLMQVMPATASYVAKKIGMKDFTQQSISQVDVNLTLGTNYLRMMHEQLDNSPVLASAGYNAGPGRPKTWRKRLGPDRRLEGALFAELIPFDETRGYVKNVMSNTVAYSLLLKNESIPLKQRLGVISGL